MEGGAPATPGSRELAPPGEAGRAPSNARSRFVTIIQEPGPHWYRWKIDARASVCMNRKKQLLRDRRRCFTMMTLSLAAAGFAGRRNWFRREGRICHRLHY